MVRLLTPIILLTGETASREPGAESLYREDFVGWKPPTGGDSALDVVDGVIEVVSEGHWTLFNAPTRRAVGTLTRSVSWRVSVLSLDCDQQWPHLVSSARPQ